jgi:amino acid transporter
MASWFFGWAGTIYLSSSRILFSAAFDKLLPSGLAHVDAKTKSPFKALLFMVVPGLLVSALYVWNVFNFASLTLVSTAVIAVTFLGTGIAAVVLPFAKKELYRASPLAPFRIGKVPLISVFGLVFCAFLGYLLFEWLVDPLDLYGISLRNATSVVFMIAVYLLAVLLYLALRGFRRRSGVDLDGIFEDMPEE